MAKIIGVGDNVVDKYLDLGLMFPGGNALNVAVLSYRYGADAAYMGVLGEDRAGRHIYETLQKEGIDVSHVRITEGPNAYSEVTLVDGDRVFVGGDPGVSTQLSFTEDDFEYMKKFDLIHTSVYSYIEDELRNLKETGKIVSFDFSDSYEQSYLNKTLPYVDFAFFSGSGKSLEEIKDFQKKVSEQGPSLVLITRGSKGAILYYNGKYYLQDSVPTKVVDTLGAGDAFIASLIVSILDRKEVTFAMQKAAEDAAKTCTYYGAFGYGIEF